MVVRNISNELDNEILKFQKQLEIKVGREITYKLASKLYTKIIQESIYINGSNKIKARRKKDRKIIFNIEMKK